MNDISESHETERSLEEKETKKLREELWILLPVFIIAICFFWGSFDFVPEARNVPMVVGFFTLVLSGIRLFHIFFPESKVGAFKDAGLASEFDGMRKKIEDEMNVAEDKEDLGTGIPFPREVKAFVAMLGSFLVFLLFGYMVGTLFVMIGISYLYGYTKKGPLFIGLMSMYVLVYVFLYKMMKAPVDYGLVLKPILKSFHLI